MYFHSARNKSGGRRPGYALFVTKDNVPPIYFTVICYHACFSKAQVILNSIGLKNLPNLMFIRRVGAINVQSAIIGGDFNWDYIEDANYNPNFYDAALISLAESLPGTPAAGVNHKPDARTDEAKSTIKVNSPPSGTSLEYRTNAYDHIFARNVQNFSVLGVDGIIDMIENFRTGALAACANSFVTAALPNGGVIPPPAARTILDAWHIYRYGVSDHLPVFAKFQI